MMRFIRMSAFQLREFARTTYFLELVLSATIAVGIIQRLGHAGWGGDPWLGFVRTIAIGMWTLAATAAGILGFERFKGTLVFLAHGRIPAVAGIAPTVTACARFGLLAVPISAIVWWGVPALSLNFFLGCVLLWLALVSMSYLIAVTFLASPNALAYEGLLLVPLLALSGIFDVAHLSDYSRFLIPAAGAFRFLVHGELIDATASILLTCGYLLLSLVVARITLKAARTSATIELV